MHADDVRIQEVLELIPLARADQNPCDPVYLIYGPRMSMHYIGNVDG